MEGILGRIVAIVLGLIALAGVGVAAYNGFQNSKASDVTTAVAALITNARAQFSQSSNLYANFTTANVAKLITAGIIPQNLTNGSTTAIDPWGNSLAFAGVGAPANSQGQITFGGGGSETTQECVSVTQNLKDYISLKVGTTTFTPASQPDPTTAATACSATAAFVLTFQ